MPLMPASRFLEGDFGQGFISYVNKIVSVICVMCALR